MAEPETAVSYLDQILSGDPVPSAIADLFPESSDASHAPAGPRESELRLTAPRPRRPETTGVAATVCLGIVWHVEIRQQRISREPGRYGQP